MRKDAAATRQRILELAAVGGSPKAIAATLGVTDRTVRHHLNDAEAAGELRRLQDERLRVLTRQAVVTAEGALNVLRALATDTTERGDVRVAAARAILENALRLVEAVDVAERLDHVERWLEAIGEEPEGGKGTRWRRPA